jgi:hypothetical protein
MPLPRLESRVSQLTGSPKIPVLALGTRPVQPGMRVREQFLRTRYSLGTETMQEACWPVSFWVSLLSIAAGRLMRNPKVDHRLMEITCMELT